MKSVKIMLSMGLVLILSACGDEEVEKDKENIVKDVGSVTTADLSESRSLCTILHRKDEEVRDHDAPMIESRCARKGGKDFFASKLDEGDDLTKGGNRGLVAHQKRVPDPKAQKMKKARRDLPLVKKVVEYPERYPRTVGLKGDVADIQKEKQVLGAAMIDDFSKPKEESSALAVVSRNAEYYLRAKKLFSEKPGSPRYAKELERAKRVLFHSLKKSSQGSDKLSVKRRAAIKSILLRVS